MNIEYLTPWIEFDNNCFKCKINNDNIKNNLECELEFVRLYCNNIAITSRRFFYIFLKNYRFRVTFMFKNIITPKYTTD